MVARRIQENDPNDPDYARVHRGSYVAKGKHDVPGEEGIFAPPDAPPPIAIAPAVPAPLVHAIKVAAPYEGAVPSVRDVPVEPDAGLAFDVRPSAPGDLAFLEDTWVASSLALPVQYGPHARKLLHWRARELLGRYGARVACDRTDPSVILGWATVALPPELPTSASPALLLWAYVRREMRRQGIARALLADVLEAPSLLPITARGKVPHLWKTSHFVYELALGLSGGARS